MQKHKIKSKSFIILVVMLSYLFIGNMRAVYSVAFPYRDQIKLLIAGIGCIIMVHFLLTHKVKAKNVLLICFLFTLFMIIPTFYLYYSTVSFTYAILQTGEALVWIGVLSCTYCIGIKNKLFIEDTKWLACFVPIYAYLFLGVKQFSAGTGIALISTAYYTLFLLPFVFLLKNKIVKWIFVLIIFSTILLSVKRTGFIAFVLCLVLYFYCNIKYRDKEKYGRKKMWLIVGMLIAFVGLYVFFEYYTASHSIAIVERLQSMNEDGGSGRTDVWIYTLGMIKQSDFISLIFGHGFNAVYQNSGLHLSAHTDILEVIYDYGVIGFGIYIAFIMRLFKYWNYIKRKRKDLAASYAASLVLFICMSLFAHLIIYPTHFLLLCLFWGLVMGNIDYSIKYGREINNV